MTDFPVLKPLVHCGNCGQDQSITNFRVLKEDPPLFTDFCGTCEKHYGTLTLYKKHAGTRWVNRTAHQWISAGADPDAQKLEKKAVDYREEQVREFARRELSRKYLLYYVKQFNPTYLIGWVHKDICRRLEQFVRDVEQGLSPRLMLFMPPRHGKSTLVSLELPGWVLGRHPEWEIISASYASSLPIGFSRTIKDRLDDADYHAIFPETQLRPDARGVEEWHTTKRGRYRAAGVEGGITGTGANIMIIDDPIKDYQEAQSPKVRENAYNWYTSTARSRMSPGGGVLIVMTRWHDGDLAGGLLTDKQALLEANVPIEELDDWQVVSYPAIAEYDEYLFPDRTVRTGPEHVPEGSILLRKKDEALHPERYSQLELRRIRNTMPSVQWNALYQQNPVPETGEYFTKDMFRTYNGLPGAEDDYAYFMAWDLAIGEKSQNDWTVGTVCAYHWSGSIYVLDMIRARMNVHGIINAMISMGKKWPGIQVLGIEYGQIYKTMAPLINEAIQREKLKFSISEDLKPVTDKLMRARPLQQKMQTGLIHFPTAQPWVSLVERELLRFPSGTHDDIVDSLAWLIRMSMVISPPKPQKARAQGRKPDSWKKQLVAKSGAKSFMTA